MTSLLQKYSAATTAEERRRIKALMLIENELSQMALRADMRNRAPRELERVHIPPPRVPFLKFGKEIEQLPEKLKGDPVYAWGVVDDAPFESGERDG